MNHVMFGAMLGGLEILMILLVLLLMAGLAVGVVLLAVWLVRRGERPAPAPRRAFAEGDQRTGAARWLSLVEVRDGRPHIRWGVYFLALAAVMVGYALVNGLLLVAGFWSGVDTVLFGLLVGVVVFNIFVLRDFHRAGKSGPANSLPFGGAPSVNPPPDSRTPAPPAAVPCPRCGATLPPNSPQGLCPRCVLGVGLATQTEATGEFGSQGTKIVPPPEADVARRFPQLEILGCLGHGGMGVVYKARQPKLNRLVALKILAPEKGADPKFAERFLREAQALARLSHPNIVTVHDFGEAEGMFFLLMEYVDGMTLRQLLREARMKPEEALAIVPPICEALQFAHEQGVVHRDIKPENVLLDKQGRVKIADFGIAKLVGAESPRSALTEERSIIGTPHYMAPEQLEKPQLVDHRADIYSLGVVFYEMLTGELPLGKFQPPSKKVQVDVRLDEVVLHALEKEPGRRYQHASQVKSDVETIAATQSTAPATGRNPVAIHVKRWRDLWLWDTGYLALFLIVPALAAGILVLILMPQWGLKALWLFTFELIGLGLAATYAWVGQRIRQLKAALPRPTGEVAEGLLFRRPFQSPGLAVLYEDRLELIPLKGSPITVALEDIVAVSEVRWFNGTRLWWKRGFVLELADGRRAGVAVAEPFARRWRSRLSRGSLPEIPADSDPAESRATAAARSQVQAPAVGILIVAVLNYLLLVASAQIGGHGVPTLPFLFVTGSITGLILVGAVQMWRGKTYGLAVAASILVMLFPPACVLGFPLGIWALVVLTRQEVRAAFANRIHDSPGRLLPQMPPSRGSGAWKTAAIIAAAVMLILAVPVGVLLLSLTWSYVASQRAVTAQDSNRVVRVEEKLRQEIERRLSEAGWRVEALSVSVTPDLKRAECRFGPAWKNGLSETPFNAVIRVAPQGRNLWQVTGDGQFQFLRFSVDTSAEVAAAQDSPPPMSALLANFGAVREVTLNDIDELRGAEALDLDSGKLLDLPKEIETRPEPERLQWLKDQSADLLLDHVAGRWGLMTIADNELKLVPLLNDSWEASSESSLSNALAGPPGGVKADPLRLHRVYANNRWEMVRERDLPVKPPPALEVKQRGDWRVYVLASNAPPPLTFAFKTASGASGLLQLAAFTEKPNSARLRFKLLNPSDKGNSPRAAASQAELPPVAQAEPGEFKLTLANGVSVEVVVVTRNPLENKRWWKPDGTPLPESPGGRVIFHPAGMAREKDLDENQHALLVRYNFPPAGQSARHQTRYTPAAEHLGTLEIQQADRVTQVVDELKRSGRKLTGGAGGPKASSQVIGYADVVRFPAGTAEATVQCATAAGPWEPVAVFDGRQTKVLVENVQVLCTHLRQEANGKCLDVTHDVDRERYALRMMAVFKAGQRAEVGLHSGVHRARETQGYVLLEPGQRVEDIKEFQLERTPWVRGEIRNVALKPLNGPASARAGNGFGPVVERTLYSVSAQKPIKGLDLDSGEEVALPAEMGKSSEAQFFQWLGEHGIDLMAFGHRQSWELWTTLKLAALDAAAWEQAGDREIRGALDSGSPGLERVEPDSKAGYISYLVERNTTLPLTFACQTKAGGLGIVEVTSFAAAPPGVTIRYKLVETPRP